jgi:hypothetical protein
MTTRSQLLAWTALSVLVAFLGLCTLFVSVVTLAQARQEHAQSHWPQATGRIEKCALTHSIEHRQTPEVLHPLPLDLPGRIRTKRRDHLLGLRSLSRCLAISSQPDCPARNLDRRASTRYANHHSLRPDEPQPSATDVELHAARRRTKNSEQHQIADRCGRELHPRIDDSEVHATSSRHVSAIHELQAANVG